MTSTSVSVTVNKTPFQVVNLRAVSQRDSTHSTDHRRTSSVFGAVSFVQYHPDFAALVGKDAVHALLLSSAETSRNPFFHFGCVRVFEPTATASDEEVLYTTSNLLQTTSSAQLPVILMSRIVLRRDPSTGYVAGVEWSKLRPPPTMPMPAGAIPSTGAAVAAGGGSRSSIGSSSGSNGRNGSTGGTGGTGVLYCVQGNPGPGTSGLFYMPHGKPPQPVVTNYYGRDFNSVHDVARGPDGALWFTDPWLGFAQDFRKRPQLPCHIYRFQPATGDLRVVADSLRQPTGLCLSPDATTLYVTDTDALHGDGNQLGNANNGSNQDGTRPATIYAFDVLRRAGADFLANQRVFAYALRGAPIGIQCDDAGNVYAGCADGVEVWNAGGTLLGVIEVPGGVTNLCFGQHGELFLCAEQRLWWVHFKPRTAEPPPDIPADMAVDSEENFI